MTSRGAHMKSTTMALALLILLVYAPSSSHADTKRWNSNSGGDWFDPTKWEPQGVPESTDDVYISNGGTYVINHNGQSNIKSLHSLGTGGNVADGQQTLVIAGGIMTIASTSLVDKTGILQVTSGTISTNSGAQIIVQGLAEFTDNNEKTLSNIQLIIRSQMTHYLGGILMENGATIQIAESGNMTINSQDGITIPSDDKTDNALINSGLVVVAPDASAQHSSVISCRVESTGIFIVTDGALTINSLNTTWANILSVNESTASVDFTIGTHTFLTSSIMQGSGVISATNEAVMQLGGTVTISRFQVMDGGVSVNVLNSAINFQSLYVKNGKFYGPSVHIGTFEWEGGSVLVQSLNVDNVTVLGSDSRSLTSTTFSIRKYAYFQQPTEIFLNEHSILELGESAQMLIDKPVAFMCQKNDTSVLKVSGLFNFTYAAPQLTLVSCIIQIDDSGTFSVDKGSVNFGNKLTSSGTLHVAANADAAFSYQEASVMTRQSSLIGEGSVTCISCDLEISSQTVNIGVVQLPTGKINFVYDSGTSEYKPLLQLLNQSGSAVLQLSNTARSSLNLNVGTFLCNGGTIMSNQDTAFGSLSQFIVNNQSLFSGGTAINIMNVAFVNKNLLTFAGNGPVQLYGATTLLNLPGAQWIVTGTLAIQQLDFVRGFATTINNMGTMRIMGKMQGLIKLSNNGGISVPTNGLINVLQGAIVQNNSLAEIVMQGGGIATTNPLYIQSGVLRGFGNITGDVMLTGEIRPQYKPSASTPYTRAPLHITGDLQQRSPAVITIPFFANGTNTGGQLTIGSTYSIWGGSLKIANASSSPNINVVARAPPASEPVVTYGSLVTSSSSYSFDSVINANINATTGLGVEIGETSITINYAPVPVATSVSPSSGTTRGSTIITIAGSNFLGSSVTVRFCGQIKNDVSIVSGNKITTQTPPGTGSCSICVIVDGRGCVGNSNLTFTYDAPTVQSISPLHGPTVGGSMITLAGVNFGTSPGSISVTVGNSSCYNLSLVTSDTLIACQVPGGVGANVPISISVGGQRNDLKNFTYSYDAPVINDICPPVGNVSGGVKMRVFGYNFAPSYPTDISSYVSVDIAGKQCTNVKLESIDEISCVTPPLDATKDNNNQTTFKVHVTVRNIASTNDALYRVYSPSTDTTTNTVPSLYYLIYGITVGLVFLLGLVLGVAFIHYKHKHTDSHQNAHVQEATEYTPIIAVTPVKTLN